MQPGDIDINMTPSQEKTLKYHQSYPKRGNKMAHDEQPTPKQNVITLQLKDFDLVNTPTLSDMSGAVFLSGGALYFKGSGGTVTEVAVA